MARGNYDRFVGVINRGNNWLIIFYILIINKYSIVNMQCFKNSQIKFRNYLENSYVSKISSIGG